MTACTILAAPVSAAAAGDDGTITGEVVSTESRWGDARSIVTESIIATDDGRRLFEGLLEAVSQPA